MNAEALKWRRLVWDDLLIRSAEMGATFFQLKVINLRFGIDDGQERSFGEIARQLETSEKAVKRSFSIAMKKRRLRLIS